MKLDSQGHPDIARVEYTKVEEDARAAITNFKLHINMMLHHLITMQAINSSGEIKRLMAMGISDIEKGAVMAVKAMTTEGFIVRAPNEGLTPSSTPPSSK